MTLTKFRVQSLSEKCIIVVTATDKDHALVVARQALNDHRIAYNRKYRQSFIDNGVAWAARSEDASDIVLGSVRKSPVKKGSK